MTPEERAKSIIKLAHIKLEIEKNGPLVIDLGDLIGRIAEQIKEAEAAAYAAGFAEAQIRAATLAEEHYFECDGDNLCGDVGETIRAMKPIPPAVLEGLEQARRREFVDGPQDFNDSSESGKE